MGGAWVLPPRAFPLGRSSPHPGMTKPGRLATCTVPMVVVVYAANSTQLCATTRRARRGFKMRRKQTHLQSIHSHCVSNLKGSELLLVVRFISSACARVASNNTARQSSFHAQTSACSFESHQGRCEPTALTLALPSQWDIPSTLCKQQHVLKVGYCPRRCCVTAYCCGPIMFQTLESVMQWNWFL